MLRKIQRHSCDRFKDNIVEASAPSHEEYDDECSWDLVIVEVRSMNCMCVIDVIDVMRIKAESRIFDFAGW